MPREIESTYEEFALRERLPGFNGHRQGGLPSTSVPISRGFRHRGGHAVLDRAGGVPGPDRTQAD